MSARSGLADLKNEMTAASYIRLSVLFELERSSSTYEMAQISLRSNPLCLKKYHPAIPTCLKLVGAG